MNKSTNVQNIHKIITSIKAKNSFTKGYCYDFALILWLNIPNTTIVYLNSKKHYLIKYKNRYFDINGEIKLNDKDILNLEIDNTKKDLLKVLKTKVSHDQVILNEVL